jgi:hypothetical protein
MKRRSRRRSSLSKLEELPVDLLSKLSVYSGNKHFAKMSKSNYFILLMVHPSGPEFFKIFTPIDYFKQKLGLLFDNFSLKTVSIFNKTLYILDNKGGRDNIEELFDDYNIPCELVEETYIFDTEIEIDSDEEPDWDQEMNR